MKCRLTLAAIADIEGATAFYEGRREGLGESFLGRVQAAIEPIERAPEGYAPVIRDVRRIHLQQFPFALWYRIAGDAIIIGCLDSRRDPMHAMHRALGIADISDPEP